MVREETLAAEDEEKGIKVLRGAIVTKTSQPRANGQNLNQTVRGVEMGPWRT
jgi:hypothetical protein